MRVLLIGENSVRTKILDQSLTKAGYHIVAKSGNTRRLLAQINEEDADGVVIEVDAAGPVITDQIRHVSQNHPCPIVIFSQRGNADASRDAIKAGVSAFVVDGLKSERVSFIMEVAITRFHETQALQKELQKALADLQERKSIERAKGILMKKDRLSEETAYNTLRKMAMSHNKRLVDVAESIITAEECLALGLKQ